tara:strand:- start:3390 stop:5378 length:1989 start_codon:yes stop_codon:yes gene_type:complete
MLGIMGTLDQQVNDKADSMQMQGKTSTVSKDLLDVMATQKIARDKDTALKELQMAQQTNPNTIKDQLEQKVMGMTQNEMTTQTGGILANRAQQQGKPQPPKQGGIMGAMGGGKPPMPQGAPRPPMPQGAPQPPMGGAPRPPMAGLPSAMGGGAPRPMMASGGIVGYNKGATIISDTKLKDLGLTRKQFEALAPAAQQALAKPLSNQDAAKQRMDARQEELRQNIAPRRAEKEAEKRQMNQRMAQNNAAPDDLRAGLGMLQTPTTTPTTPAPADKPFFPTPTGEKPELPKPPMPQAGSQAGPQGGAPVIPPVTGGIATDTQEKVNPRAVTDSATAGENIISDKFGSANKQKLQDMADVDPMTERAAEQTRLDTLYGKTAIEADLKKADEGIASAQAAYDSPEKRRQRDLEGFRRAGVGGMRQVQQSRDELSIKRARQFKDDTIKNADESYKRAEKIDTGTSTMLKDMRAQQKAALASLETLANNDQTAKQNMMQLRGNLEGKVQDQLLKMMEIESTNALRASIQNATTITELNSVWAKYMNNVQTLAAEKLTDLMPQATEIIAKGDKATDEELRMLKNAEEMISGIIYAETAAINQMFTTQMAQLNPQLAKLNLGSSLASMGGMPQLQSLQRSGIGGVSTSSTGTQLSTPAAKADFLTFGQKP